MSSSDPTPPQPATPKPTGQGPQSGTSESPSITPSATRGPLPASPPLTSPLAALRTDLPAALCAVFLLLIPLYRTGTLEDSFNTPKIALATIIALITAIAILVRPHPIRGSLRHSLPVWLLVILAAWQAISALWASSKPLAVDGTVYFALFAVWGWIFLRSAKTVQGIRALFHAGALAATATAAWVLWEDFTGGTPGIVARLPDWRGLLSAGVGNSGHIAGIIGMFLPWLILNFLRTTAGPLRWLTLLAITLAFSALTITWSVGSSGATILSLLLWTPVAIKTIPRGHLRWTRLIPITAAGLAVIAFFFTPHPANPHNPGILKQAFSSDRWEAGWPTRIVIWKTTLHIISRAPLTGIGTGNFTYEYPQQIVPSIHSDPALQIYAGSFTNDAHNDYLQVWAETGVIGIALWLAILTTYYAALKQLLTRPRNLPPLPTATSSPAHHHHDILIAAGAGLTVFVLDGLMSFPMRLPAHFAIATFFLAVPGLISRHIGPTPSVSTPDPGMIRRWRTGGVGIVLILAACTWHIGHRVVAEFHLKAGRNIAESPLLNTGTGYTSPWTASRMLHASLLEAIANQASPSEVQSIASTMKNIAHTPPMRHARHLFEQSLNANRWYANASSRLGDLLIFQNQWQESLRISRRTLRTLETFEVHERLGLAAYMSNDMPLARKHWTICRQRMPHTAHLYDQLIQSTHQ